MRREEISVAGSGIEGGPLNVVDGVIGHGDARVLAHESGREIAKRGTSGLPRKVAIVGFGTVGQSVAKVLESRGGRTLALSRVVNRDVERKRQQWRERNDHHSLAEVHWSDDFGAALAAEVDIVVELIGGLHPAKDLVARALSAGKSVVTANKQLIAAHGAELEQIARAAGTHLLYGAAVCGGMPVLPALVSGLRGDDITDVRGILNGTCNYILTRIEDVGMNFDEALREAQKLGYAEADPTDDVDGYDARAKLAILARVALGRAVNAEAIPCHSIRQVMGLDFTYARRIGCTIRQISYAGRENGTVAAWVGPALVPLASAEARLKGSQNVVVTRGEFGGENVFSGYGAGGNPTAVAVVSDIVAIANGGVSLETGTVRRAELAEEFVCPRFVRIVINDRPGVLAALASAFSRHGINIDSVLQEPGFQKNWLPFVMTLDACGERQLESAVEEIAALESIVERPLALPVLG
jgi:homoserine dehydrogenase